MFTRKSIIQKTIQVSGSTLLSRLLGVIREVLTVNYLGASALSDAFFTAWKIPNSLRKIFAEGALSAAFVPTIVQTVRKEGRESIGSFMTLGFLIFESMVLLICILGMIFAPFFIKIIAPGFSQAQIEAAATFLYILMPFIFLISFSALLAGPLQAVGHFFVPAFGPVLLNIVYILGLVVCMVWNLPVTVLCWFILVGGIVQLLAHLFTYFKLHFTFAAIQKEDLKQFGSILLKFFWCLLSMSVMEIGLFLDTSFASLLSKGSISLIYYANRFMGIPLGVFAVAFSTILLPHFSRVSAYAPKRLGFYLMQATKLIWWVTFPVAIIMIFLSRNIFLTVFLSEKFTIAQVDEAAMILNAFLAGLFFFAINKILMNVYYALHETRLPGIIAVISVLLNAFLNWILMGPLQATGLAIATTLSGIIQTILLFVVLKTHFKINLFTGHLWDFILKYTIQITIIGVPFIVIYNVLWYAVNSYCGSFFICRLGYWLWVTPLSVLFVIVLYTTRKRFKTDLSLLGD